MKTTIELMGLGILVVLIVSSGSFASHQAESGGLTLWTWGAIATLTLVWLLATVSALLAAVSLYSPESKSRVNVRSKRFLAVWNPSKVQVLGHAAFSYGMTVYLFSVVFVLVGRNDIHAFMPPIETLGTGAYFSIVTIATVGYGDIQPVTSLARFMACSEILAGVAYSVFFFSVVAGFLRERSER